MRSQNRMTFRHANRAFGTIESAETNEMCRLCDFLWTRIFLKALKVRQGSVARGVHAKIGEGGQIGQFEGTLNRNAKLVQMVGNFRGNDGLAAGQVEVHFGDGPIGYSGRIEDVESPVIPPTTIVASL